MFKIQKFGTAVIVSSLFFASCSGDSTSSEEESITELVSFAQESSSSVEIGAESSSDMIIPESSSAEILVESSSETIDVIVDKNRAKRLVEKMGTGINLGNVFEAPNTNFKSFDPNVFKSDWSETIVPTDFKALGDSGFTNMRIPTSWEEHVELVEGKCVVDPEWMNQVFWAVDNAISSGMIVVLNAHHWDAMYSRPDAETPCLLDVYAQMAERAKTYSPDSLVIETLNEPRAKLTSALWNNLVASIIDVVRSIDPNRVIMVGTHNYNAYNTCGLLQLPANADNLILTFHYYEPMNFTHQGNDFTDEKYPTGVEWRGSANQQRVVKTAFTKLKNWADTKGLPVYLGEYGTYQAVDSVSRESWTTFVNSMARSLGFATAYWEFSSSFGVYDETTGEWKDYLMRALLNPMMEFNTAPHPNLDTVKYVVLDNFDDDAEPTNITTLSAEIMKAKGDTVENAPGRWYAYHINTSMMYVDGGDTLVTSTLLMDSTKGYKETNFERLITENGHEGKGLYVKIDLKGKAYPWAGIGTTIDGEKRINFKKLQAVTFWAKGEGQIKVDWSTDYADTCCKENWGTFNTEINLTDEWKQYTIWWDDWTASAWSELAELGAEWVDHNDDVTKLQFSNGTMYGEVADEVIELYLDDIRFYGMDESDFGIGMASQE